MNLFKAFNLFMMNVKLLLLLLSLLVMPMVQAELTKNDYTSDIGEVLPATPNLSEARAAVEDNTRDLLSLIEEAQEYVDEDEQRFLDELTVMMNRTVDFKTFSRRVMGKYAGKTRIESLSPEEQKRLLKQIDRFEKVFADTLIRFYGKGLLTFEGERIEVVPPRAEAEESARNGKANIKQLIYGEREKPFEIIYSLRKNQEGQWMIRDMKVEGSIVGSVYRKQFYNAYRVYEGDIDKVIDNWAVGQ